MKSNILFIQPSVTLIALCMLAGGGNAYSAGVSSQPNVVQRFDGSKSTTISGTELAQLSQPKVPSLADDISSATDLIESMSDVDLDTTATDAALGLTPDTAREIDSLDTQRTGVNEENRDSLLSLPSLDRGTTSTTASDIKSSLLSLPPLGYDDTSTTLDLDSLQTSDYAMTSGSTTEFDMTSGTIDLDSLYASPRAGNVMADIKSLTEGRNVKRMPLLNVLCQSLASNQALRIERLRPEISNTNIEAAEGEFDTVLSGGVGYGSQHSSTLSPKAKHGKSNRSDDIAVSRNLNYDAALSGRAPTGTDYSLSFSGNRNGTNKTEHFFNNSLNLNITQNLLRGAGCDVNLISVWTAQNDFVISLYQLQNTLINLVTDVQISYWNVYLAYETLDIRLKAAQVAREQRERTEEFVRVGRSAPLDTLAAQAEEASRVSDVINAVSNLKIQQLQLLRLINPENLNTGWRSLIFPNEAPILPTEKLVPEERVKLARYYRPDLRQAQIDLANNELQVYRTTNGLLPQLDFVIDAGLTGKGDSQGDSARMLVDTDTRNYGVGLQFSYPLQNRRANAANRRANFQKNLAEEAIVNFCQIIDVDVRSAILEIERTSRLIFSTQVTEELRRRQLEAETEKFRVGRSTQLEVSQAQRDYVQAQLARVTAEVANINSYLELYRVEGTALQRRGVQPIHITPESGVPAG